MLLIPLDVVERMVFIVDVLSDFTLFIAVLAVVWTFVAPDFTAVWMAFICTFVVDDACVIPDRTAVARLVIPVRIAAEDNVTPVWITVCRFSMAVDTEVVVCSIPD